MSTQWQAFLLVGVLALTVSAPAGIRANLSGDAVIDLQTTMVMPLMTVGNPGNAGEWSGESYGGYGPDRVCGGVDYGYNIGKSEVKAGQYTEFLNAMAATDTHALYSDHMGDTSAETRGCNIQRNGSSGSYTYSVAPDWAGWPFRSGSAEERLAIIEHCDPCN